MKEMSLKSAPVGMRFSISRCLSPSRQDVYRLLEMGFCKGAQCQILHKAPLFGAIEVALNNSRICVGLDLAEQFLIESKG